MPHGPLERAGGDSPRDQRYLRASRPRLRPWLFFYVTHGLGFILMQIIALAVDFHPMLVIAAYGASISTVLTIYALLMKINRRLARSRMFACKPLIGE